MSRLRKRSAASPTASDRSHAMEAVFLPFFCATLSTPPSFTPSRQDWPDIIVSWVLTVGLHCRTQQGTADGSPQSREKLLAERESWVSNVTQAKCRTYLPVGIWDCNQTYETSFVILFRPQSSLTTVFFARHRRNRRETDMDSWSMSLNTSAWGGLGLKHLSKLHDLSETGQHADGFEGN